MERSNDGSRHGCGNWACRGHGAGSVAPLAPGRTPPPCGPSGARVRLCRGRARRAGANSGWASNPAGRQADEAKGRWHATQQGGPTHLPQDHRGTATLPADAPTTAPVGAAIPAHQLRVTLTRTVCGRVQAGGAGGPAKALERVPRAGETGTALRQAGLATASGFSPPGSVAAFGGGDTRGESVLGGYPIKLHAAPCAPPSWSGKSPFHDGSRPARDRTHKGGRRPLETGVIRPRILCGSRRITLH